LKSIKDKKRDPVLDQLLDLCVKKKYGAADKQGNIQIQNYRDLMMDPETRVKLVELYARPLKALQGNFLASEPPGNGSCLDHLSYSHGPFVAF